MDIDQIQQHLREGPPDEPRYRPGPLGAPRQIRFAAARRPGTRGPFALAGGALVILVAALVGLLALSTTLPSDVGRSSSQPAVAPPATVTPSAVASPTSSAPADCDGTDLQLSIPRVEGAAGSRIVSFALLNLGQKKICAVSIERARMLDGARGRRLVEVEVRPPLIAHLVAGESVAGLARWSNHCGPVPVGLIRLSLQLGTGSWISSGGRPDVDVVVPPCLATDQPATLELRFGPAPTATPTARPTPTATASPTARPRRTATPRPISSATPTPTTTPTPTATATATPSVCRATVARSATVEGAAGSRILHLPFVAPATQPSCTFRIGRAWIRDAAGRTLVTASAPTGDAAALPLAPGGSIDVTARWSNWCGTIPIGPLTMNVSQGGRAVTRPIDGDASSVAPPCLGPGQPSVLEVRLEPLVR